MDLWRFPETILYVMLRGQWSHAFGFSRGQMPPHFKAACKSKTIAVINLQNLLSALGAELIRVSSQVQHPQSHTGPG